MDYLNPVILIPALAILCAIYTIVPAKFRWLVLLSASYAFYFWIGSWAVLILVLLTLVNYFLGLRIERSERSESSQSGTARKLLILGIFINLVSLIFFKYGDSLFFPQNSLSALNDPVSRRILLPLGMSFYTLQNIAYLLDVSKKLIPAERHLGVFATFIAFFPKVASGPIERGKKLLPQLHSMNTATSQDIILGFRQVIFGLFKKLVIADRLAIIVNQVFGSNGTYNGLPVVYAILFLAFQIYFDFAGYTDIAIGAARLFGIELSINFKRPYLATDVADFWNRWHLSFSTWLRDYIFYPIRRFLLKRQADSRTISMILPPLVTMLLSGAWHGAGWNFIAWGLIPRGFLHHFPVRQGFPQNAPAPPGRADQGGGYPGEFWRDRVRLDHFPPGNLRGDEAARLHGFHRKIFQYPVQ